MEFLAVVQVRDDKCLNEGNVSEDGKKKTNTRHIGGVGNIAYSDWLVEEEGGKERFWSVSQVLIT